jgi:hypothetical protein
MREEDIATRKGYWADAIVSTSDTVTFSALTTVTFSAVCKKADGATVAHTKATNIITITEAALTNVLVEIFVNGVV